MSDGEENVYLMAPRTGGKYRLTAAGLTCALKLDPAELLSQPVPYRVQRVRLAIRTPSRIVYADVSAKRIRKARALIESAGEGAVSLLLRGRLSDHNLLVEAGLAAQLKGVTSIAGRRHPRGDG
jgi:hypothetical protein